MANVFKVQTLTAYNGGTISLSSGQILDNNNNISIDFQNRELSGNWNSQNFSISGIPIGNVGNTGILTGVFYPLNSNPAGYTTSGGNTGQLTGAFYPLNLNPSNYITSSQTGVFVTTGQTGSFGGSSNTGILTGAFYPLVGNPSNFITPTQSGLLTGTFYPLNTNPSNYVTISQTGVFVTTGNTGNFITSVQSGLLTGTFYPLHSNPSNYIILSQVGGVSSLVVTGYNLSGSVTLTGISGVTITTGNSTQIIIGINTGLFYGSANPSNYITNLQTGVFYTNNNPSGFITGLNTGNFITTSQTGNFITTSQTGNFVGLSQTGQFYSSANPSNYVTQTQTGLLSGQFYPLVANPNNYITPTQSGLLTGTFYPLNSNPAGYTTNGGNTGQLTGAFYPLNSNPSGYINSYPTGAYLFSTGISNGINNQFISFPTNLGISPFVICSLNNTLGGEQIFAQPSGIVSSGYYAQFSNTIDSTGYILNTFACISSLTGLAVSVVNNNTYNTIIQGSGVGLFSSTIQVSGNFNITTGNSVYLVNTLQTGTSGIYVGSTGTFPNSAALAGFQFTIKDWKGNSYNNNIVLTGTSNQTFDGTGNIIMNVNYISYNFISDGSNWSII